MHSLGIAGATCFQTVVPGIRAHRERYPGVLVSPEQRNTPLLVAGLRSGEIDVAFIRPPLSDAEGLEVEPLVEEPMVIVLPESHPRAGDRSMALAALAEETLIVFSHFGTSMTAPIASGWSDCRVGLALTGKRRLRSGGP
jgi:DNA-binding transcriptional LysR family regulator